MKVLLRAVVLAVLAAAVGVATNLLSDDGTANIGAGLFAFLAVIVVAFVWGLRDARRDHFGRVLLRWVVVGLFVGLGFAVLPQVGDPGFFSLTTYLGDLPFSGLFALALTAVAAWLGALVGFLTGGRRRARSTEPQEEPVQA